MITLAAGHEIMTKHNNMSELQWLESIARTCYKSEEKITEDGESARELIRKLLARKHYAMLEHLSIIFEVDYEMYKQIKHLTDMINELVDDQHTYLKFSEHKRFVISGNIRAWRDFTSTCINLGWGVPFGLLYSLVCRNGCTVDEDRKLLFGDIFDADKICEESFTNAAHTEVGVCLEIDKEELTGGEIYNHYPITIKWTCDRGVSHELVRHRDASFAQESTRYCNYSKDKYGNECTFIDLYPGIALDAVVAKLSPEVKHQILEVWVDALQYAEKAYLKMTELGATPQIARSVLPSSTKTEVVMTATADEWLKFFSLRLPISAHPQMREITEPAFANLCDIMPSIFNENELEV